MFDELIESGRRLVAKNERYRHTDISDIPIGERLASSETSAWFKAATTLIVKAFGQDSMELAQWIKLQTELNAISHDEIWNKKSWNEGAANVRQLHASMGLLTEFQIYVNSNQRGLSDVPVEVVASLERFRFTYPDASKVAFVMMRFGKTKAQESISAAIRTALEPFGITAVRADDKQYHDDLFPNILTYIHGCGFGVAIFERTETDDFNSNVALEVGYMLALKKHVCFLKDRTLKTLQVDLIGKLYRIFDPFDPMGTIPSELSPWLRDKNLGTR
jgi:hypothetical protein